MKCLIRFILVLGLLISSAMVYINPAAYAEQDQNGRRLKNAVNLEWVFLQIMHQWNLSIQLMVRLSMQV